MNQLTVRKGVLAGLNLTATDHALNPLYLKNAENIVLTNGKAVKRQGMIRYNTRQLTRSMVCQRKTVFSPSILELTPSGAQELSYRRHIPLGYGLIRWTPNFQPTLGVAFSRDFRFFTGDLVVGENYMIHDQSTDLSDQVGETQWTRIRRTLRVYIGYDGSNAVLRVELDLHDDQTDVSYVAIETAGTIPIVANTDLHIGITYDGSTIRAYVDGILDIEEAVTGADHWSGEVHADTNFGRPDIVILNNITVRRMYHSDQEDTYADTIANRYLEYPVTEVMPAPAQSGIYEIRFWNSVQNYSSALYPRNRPLTSAEVSNIFLIGYWKCDEGGGGYARDLKNARNMLLLPNTATYVADARFASGIGLEFADGGYLRYHADKNAAFNDPIARSLTSIFESTSGSFGPTWTAMIRFITPDSRLLRTGYENEGRNFLFTIELGRATFEDDIIMRPQPVLTAWIEDSRIYVEEFKAFGAAVPAPIIGPVLTDNTIYTITLIRQTNGNVEVYLNNNAASSASGAGIAYLGTLQTAGIAIGRQSCYYFDRFISLDIDMRLNPGTDGHFKFEWFRFWNTAITASLRRAVYNRPLEDHERSDPNLIINLEINKVTGLEVPSYAVYPARFHLAQSFANHHVGPENEWWDNFASAVPPYWGSHSVSSSWDPVGAEAQCEALANYQSVLKGSNQLATLASGVFYLDNYSLLLKPQIQEQRTGPRNYSSSPGIYSSITTFAERLLLLNDSGSPQVWTGKALAPLGINLPQERRIYNNQLLPRIALGISGTLNGYYSYKFVYRDSEFNVVSVLGPTVGINATNDNILVGKTSTGAAIFHDKLIKKHLNSRVSIIDVYRSRSHPTAANAEAGPFLHLRRLPNTDYAIDDNTPDIELGEILIDDFIDTPEFQYAAMYNSRLVVGNIYNEPDRIAWTPAGNVEQFRQADSFPTEDGTGGAVTGIKAAYDSCWVFKERSIWQITDAQSTLVGNPFYTEAGAIAPKSIVEFISPQSGQRVIFFWSAEGPYLFNASQPIYIGQAIKADPANNPFAYLNRDELKSMVVRDVAQLGQLWLFVKPENEEQYTLILVYDYINNAWLKHTGIRLTDIASFKIPSSVTFVDDVTSGTGLYPSYIGGGYRGFYYVLLTGNRGGALLGNNLSGTGVDAPNSTISRLTVSSAQWTAKELRDLEIVVKHSNGLVERRYIKDNTTTTIDPETPFLEAPRADSSWIVSGINYVIEFPYDHVDVDTLDKQLFHLVSWHTGALFFRISADWEELSGPVEPVEESNKKRIRTYINRFLECVKLEFSNPYADSPCELIAYGFEYSPTRSGKRSE